MFVTSPPPRTHFASIRLATLDAGEAQTPKQIDEFFRRHQQQDAQELGEASFLNAVIKVPYETMSDGSNKISEKSGVFAFLKKIVGKNKEALVMLSDDDVRNYFYNLVDLIVEPSNPEFASELRVRMRNISEVLPPGVLPDEKDNRVVQEMVLALEKTNPDQARRAVIQTLKDKSYTELSTISALA